jgi:hypothetical protein
MRSPWKVVWRRLGSTLAAIALVSVTVLFWRAAYFHSRAAFYQGLEGYCLDRATETEKFVTEKARQASGPFRGGLAGPAARVEDDRAQEIVRRYRSKAAMYRDAKERFGCAAARPWMTAPAELPMQSDPE